METNVNGVKTVFGCSGTINETEAGVASGYCFAFDVATNTVSAMLALTAGEGAGVWMAGQGAVADLPPGEIKSWWLAAKRRKDAAPGASPGQQGKHKARKGERRLRHRSLF